MQKYLWHSAKPPLQLKKGITLGQNVGISLKCIFTKFEFSMPSRFQNFAVQN